MSKSRRQFLTKTSLGVLGAAFAPGDSVLKRAPGSVQEPTAGAPPAFGTGPAVGPEVSPATFAEAEKLVQVKLTSAERAVAAESWRINLESVYERSIGTRKVTVQTT